MDALDWTRDLAGCCPPLERNWRAAPTKFEEYEAGPARGFVDMGEAGRENSPIHPGGRTIISG